MRGTKKRYPAAFKARVALEAAKQTRTLAEKARTHRRDDSGEHYRATGMPRLSLCLVWPSRPAGWLTLVLKPMWSNSSNS
jgi:hypothetical protein